MTAASDFTSWLDGGRTVSDGPAWLADWRARAAQRARVLGVPGRKDESWRYTSLSALLEQDFRPAAGPALPAASALAPALITGFEPHRLVFVNGDFVAALSTSGALPEGVRLGSLRERLATDPGALEGRLGRVAGAQAPLFSTLNAAGFQDGAALLIDPGVALEQPIELLHLSLGDTGAILAQPRHCIVLGEGARATLIERYLGLDGAGVCTNAVIEVTLGQGAELRHERLQDEGAASFHLSTLHLDQAPGSRYRGVNIGLGARWARTELHCGCAGRGAECDLQGLYLAGDGQLMDYHLDVIHSVPECTSRENFKGILYGRGRAVFDGRVLVARDAQKSDAAMSNRNLMLSEQAEIDTKPQLEILADDVKCSHGTTVGQIEPEMLFYPRARGIAEPLARRMLCLGFAGEIIEALSQEALREQVTEQVGARLEQASG